MAVSIPAQVNNFVLKSTDQLGNTYETNVNKGFGNPLISTYNYADTVLRSLNGLTDNIYVDGDAIMTKSINEAIDEEG